MPPALVSTPASLVPLARRSGAARRVRTSAHASARGALGSSAGLSPPGASVASPRGFLALDRAMPATTPSTRRRATRSGAAVRAADGDAAPAAAGGGPKINLPTALTLVRVAAVPEVGGDGQGDKGGEGWEVDKLTRFFDVCPKYTAAKGDMLRERDAFLQGATVGNVVRRMQARLPAAVQLTREDVAALYTLCGFEVAHDNRTAHICSLFTEEEMEALEFLEDLKHFYKKSYGNPINAQMVCPLHHFLLRALEERARGVTGRTAELIFAHGETLLPLMTRLRLFQDSAPLTAAASRELVLHFCMSVAVPST